MKITSKVKVRNKMGLHTRPATVIVKLLQNAKSSVFFTYKQETVDAKSILSLLMLAARRNSSITITVDGEDSESTMQSLVTAFEDHFGESEK